MGSTYYREVLSLRGCFRVPVVGNAYGPLSAVNVPTVSFGLALGWVSLASGESGEGAAGAVIAAVTTFAASLLGVPLSAHALTYGRKVAVIATSATFVVSLFIVLPTATCNPCDSCTSIKIQN